MQLRLCVGSLLLGQMWASAALAQFVEVEAGAMVFHEPSKQSKMTVYAPQLTVVALAAEGVRVSADYQADIVTGASEAVKAGPLMADVPDIVSRASVSDQRQVATGALSFERDSIRLKVGYSYGTENDYRSQAFSVSVATDFLQKNTELELGYSRGFDQVCTVAQPGLSETLRRSLISSQACFTSDESVEIEPIDLHGFRVVWGQVWTPVLTTQLVASGAIAHGFLGNPYRLVVIGSSGQTALENHPIDRRRASLTFAGKYYSKLLETAIGWTARGYRDSWEVTSATAELSAERYVVPAVSVRAHGRAYVQTGASFWSDDYTGGEPQLGPRGRYWSGDRELSPLQTLLVGVAARGTWTRDSEGSALGVGAEAVSFDAGFDLLRTYLQDFTWAGQVPDDTWVLLPTLGISGTF